MANGGGIATFEKPDVDGSYTYFEYTTATGGVWKGTIGEMIADVKLTDGLKVDDLAWNAHEKGERVKPARKHWRIQSLTKMQLVWKGFEPRTEPEHRDCQIVYRRKMDHSLDGE